MIETASRWPSRWHGPHASEFLQALRRFSRDVRFPEFFARHRHLYAATERRLETFAREHVSLQWYERFFGHAADADFILVPGMCNGGANFGPKIRPKRGREELYAIVGVTQSDAEGIPTFDTTLVPTIVHEFAHSFVNPFVERHRDELSAAGERMYPAVAAMMQAQAYGNWETRIVESLVRAAVVRYLRTNAGLSTGTRQLTEELRPGIRFFAETSQSIQDRLKDAIRFDGQSADR